jgi:dihydrofolate reductase
MRKLIVSEFVSADGVMEAPGGEPDYQHSGWVMPYHAPDQLNYKLDEVVEAEALVLGRVTYEGFAAAWPERSGEFADKMNSMPKHVASTTLADLEWSNSSLIEGDVADGITALKRQDGGPLLVNGSRTLVHTLLAHDLVDVWRLMVFPLILGSGRRLFPDDAADKTDLELVDSERFKSGVVAHTYNRA